MGYANPIIRSTYTWNAVDFGAGNVATSFKGPNGMEGRIRELTVISTETFTNTTTQAFVRLGTTSDADAYAQAALGTLANTDTFVASKQDSDWIISGTLPVDTQIEVNFVAPTGGTPAGIGTVILDVEWF
ncbi:hypothetical protein ASD54_12305 [Rhizobium sp. Root149]|uniref:hypothetical protein n=1 Tax=Rhizobium sp. Root149 TaxID=1736473 RepID=UPI000714530B|nr:hypothetical protein [Rhizobium sp. Root149]KQZ49714.1 hypothetical protein ASD54_12305 [Rhizobium sp. Root149]